jgi:hypothetical protein
LSLLSPPLVGSHRTEQRLTVVVVVVVVVVPVVDIFVLLLLVENIGLDHDKSQ